MKLSSEWDSLLKRTATQVVEAEALLQESREVQNRMWEMMIRAGVPKTQIAQASGLTATAINFRLKSVRGAS